MFLCCAFFAVLPGLLFGQNLDSIKSVIKAGLTAHELPYRDLRLSYSIRYDSVQSYHDLHMDKTLGSDVLSELENRLNIYLKSCSSEDDYNGTIRFDNYTDDIFVNIKKEGDYYIFYAVVSPPQPLEGMDKFLEKWLFYLNDLKKSDHSRFSGLGQNHVFRFFVDRDGRLLIDERSDVDSILAHFIKKERRWSVGIMSGRPEIVRYDLALPIDMHGINNITTDGYRDLLSSNKVFYPFGNSKDVFYSHVLEEINRPSYNVVSMVMDDGKCVSPIIHRGNRAQCQALIQRLQELDVNKWFMALSDFRRVYFYTDLE